MSERMQLPRDEMAFRRIYRRLVESGELTTVFRPEPRLCRDERGYCVGQRVRARILKVPGSDEYSISPRFLDEPERTIVIDAVSLHALGELTREHFTGSSPDVYDVASLQYHLGLIYNLDPDVLDNDACITRIQFRYLTQE